MKLIYKTDGTVLAAVEDDPGMIQLSVPDHLEITVAPELEERFRDPADPLHPLKHVTVKQGRIILKRSAPKA